jgi:uroporphyrinogen decarboxylase
MSNMTKFERIRAAIKGEATDRVPVALWQHFPVEDMTADGLSDAAIRYQKRWDWDILKFTPTGTYMIMDHGVKTRWDPNNNGVRTPLGVGIHAPDDWLKFEKFDVTGGFYGQQIRALSQTAKTFKDSVPIFQTIFSPLTSARKLAGDRVFSDMRLHPEKVKACLDAYAEETIQFTLESIKAGAHGVFFATQNASYRVVSKAEYTEFGVFFDNKVLNAVRSQCEFIMLHNHGYDIMFELANEVGAQMVNWHDRNTYPSIQEAKKLFKGLLVGGVNEWVTLLNGTPQQVQAEVKEAIVQAGSSGLMIGPGCVCPTDVPESNLQAVRDLFK